MTTRRYCHTAIAAAVLTLCITGHAGAAGQGDWSPGPAAWTGDLTPVSAADWNYDRAEHLLGQGGVQRDAGGHPEAGGHDARAGGARPRRVRRLPERPPRTVRAFRFLGRDADAFPAEPARRDRPGNEAWREHGYPRKARRRQPPHAAGVGPLLLLAARHAARDPPRRLLVGRADARHQSPARREDGAVLARPLRHRREQGARLPQDAAPGRDVRAACDGQLPGPGGGGGQGPRRCSTTSTRA